MYHQDANINLAVERSAERMRAVRAYGSAPRSEPAPPTQPAEDGRLAQPWAARMAAVVIVAMLLVGLALVWRAWA